MNWTPCKRPKWYEGTYAIAQRWFKSGRWRLSLAVYKRHEEFPGLRITCTIRRGPQLWLEEAPVPLELVPTLKEVIDEACTKLVAVDTVGSATPSADSRRPAGQNH